jgi:hypothetical protein
MIFAGFRADSLRGTPSLQAKLSRKAELNLDCFVGLLDQLKFPKPVPKLNRIDGEKRYLLSMI